jgi:hypothetical protein
VASRHIQLGALEASSQAAAVAGIAKWIRGVYPTETRSTKRSPAIWQSIGIDQVTVTIIVVVHVKSVAHIDFRWAGNTHGKVTFRFLQIMVPRALDVVADRRYSALLEVADEFHSQNHSPLVLDPCGSSYVVYALERITEPTLMAA